MAFCATCGSEVQGKFCAKCGAPIAAAPAAAPAPPPAAAPQQQAAPGGYQPPQGGQQYQQPGGYQQPGYAPPPPGGQQYQGGYAPPPGAAQPGLQDNMANALCYALGILTGILFLVLAPYNTNKTTRFHAFQSIFFGVAVFIAIIVIWPVSFVLLFVPFGIGAILSFVLHVALWLGMFIMWLMLMYKAYNNEVWVLPVIGPLAQKQA